jgi:hypothetical protein
MTSDSCSATGYSRTLRLRIHAPPDDVLSGRHGPNNQRTDLSTPEERVAALEVKVAAHAMSASDLRGALTSVPG